MMSTQQEYSELIRNIRENDKQSLEKLFRKLYTRLRNYANTIINSREDAEDIVQEVFFKLWNNRADLDENKSIQTYLFVCTRNSCLNWLKHKRTESDYARIMALVYTRDPETLTPHESLIADDIESDFYKVLEDLPTQCRKIFELNRFEGLKYHEIATRLNISIKTVETQMSRALVKIRFQLKRHTATLFFALCCLCF
jgi:RNA polymerase sigma-70 factor (ECF subfamily)